MVIPAVAAEGLNEVLIKVNKEVTGVSSPGLSSKDEDLSRINSLSDEDLMRAYQGGDSRAFTVLYQRHSGRVYGYLRSKLRDRAQVDDVYQGTFLKLHRSRAKYDAAFPFAPWLFTVCRSVMLDHLRAKSRNLEDASEQAVIESFAGSGAEVQPEDSRSARNLDVASMPENQRLALQLRYEDELSFEEIAIALKTSPTNARQMVSRAVRRLKKTLGSKGASTEGGAR